MKILGINAFHADSSACILVNGEILGAIEEERLTRIKHWAGFPILAIQNCLDLANLKINDIDYIAINRDPNAHIFEKVNFAVSKRPSLKNIINRVRSRKKDHDIVDLISKSFKVETKLIEKKIYNVEHHLAHLASTFYTSQYEDALVLSVDGFGDFVSTMWGTVENDKISVEDYVTFPHSLGLFYQAITQYLGFYNYGDEYKIMGMAGYGNPIFEKEMNKIISCTDDGKFKLGLDYFRHQSEGVSMEFDTGYPNIGTLFTNNLENLLGSSRTNDGEITQKHKDIAASVQFQYEKVFFHIIKSLNKRFPNYKKLCLAGGCAQNSLANGKITSISSFDDVWVQPAAGDAGGALGAAMVAHFEIKKDRPKHMVNASLGLSYTNEEIQVEIANDDRLTKFDVKFIQNDDELENLTVNALIDGNVIGFFHGSFEWGPRALGNRSIIVDPRIKNMKDLLNKKIKKRESFRPFAPSVLENEVKNWFEKDESVPFMTHVFNIREHKKSKIPAVTHIDGTGRLQSVSNQNNPRYHNIISKFFNITGVPMILNTSFNENEPIVNSPKEAIACFLRTSMDKIILENYIISR
jgi:carbamoyltransferase